MMTRRRFSGLAFAAGMTAALVAGPMANGSAVAADKIILGDMNSYTGFASFTIPYRQGWELALEEINAAGGILGRQVTVVSRDDGARPADAVTVANELVSRENAILLFGTLLSHVGLAVSDFAKQKKVIFIAAEPLSDTIAWQKGNRYTFRLRPGTYVQAAMLAEEAAKLPAKRWATIAPNYEYGQSAVAAFKELLKAKRPDVEFIAEQWPALGKLDAGAQTFERLQHAQAPLGRIGQLAVRRHGEQCIGALLGPADAAPDLVKLGKPEHIGAVHDHRVGARDVEAGFDDRGGQ